MADGAIYVDSSIVLSVILQQPGAIRYWSHWSLAVTSELMEVEVLRTLDRLVALGEISPSRFAQHVSDVKVSTTAFQRVPLTPAILKRVASHFATPVGTLDAIHLATALVWVERNSKDLLFLTHDRQLATAAQASGLDVHPLKDRK
jgi:predicted nucleic acid-binding protein